MPDHAFLTADLDALLPQLSEGEKIALVAGEGWWETHPIPRLGIPSVKVTDGPNGARGGSFFKQTRASALPNATCLASTFSPSLVRSAGALLAAETKARGAVCLLAPTVNIARSPLGGRAFESFSEDPTLSGTMAAEYIAGLQENGVSATIKHLVANDQEHERNGADCVIAPRPLREIYLRPFQIAEARSRPGAYMTAYNKLNGTHCSENKWLLDVVRREWGSDALFMSDWYGTYGTAEGMNAGLSLEMPGPAIWRAAHLVRPLISAHKILPEVLDARAREVLAFVQRTAKRNPELAFGSKEERTREECRKEDAALLRRLAGEGAVLLKNEDVLPLRKGRIAIIGPHAKTAVITGGGSAQLRAAWTVSPWAGMVENKPEDIELDYSLGCVSAKYLPLLGDEFTTPEGKPGFDLAYYAIRDGEVDKTPAVKDWFDVSNMFMADFFHPSLGEQFVTELLAKFTAPITGEYEFGTVVTGQGWLYVDGELVVDNSRNQTMGEAFFNNGTIEVRGRVQVEKGKEYAIRFVHDSRRAADRGEGPFVVKGCRLGAFPVVDAERAITDAAALAAECDTAVVFVGLNADWESEGYDRADLSLPLRTDELVAAVAEANPNTVVVVQSGSAVGMPWADNVKGVIQAWYGGNELGNALADVLYGERNPSGRMPLSFPHRVQDIAAFPNAKSARTRIRYDEGVWVGYRYHNMRNVPPLWAFGHGLSYTTFGYERLGVEVKEGKGNEWSATLSVSVRNTGSVVGDHAVLVFLTPPDESATGLMHPQVTLQGYAKVYGLEPGAEERVEIKLDKYAISHWDELSDTWRAETGEWTAHVAADAGRMLASTTFNVKDAMPWRGV